MTTALIECIPNYSEGRRQDVIEAITAAVTAVSGVHLLDRHSDIDHNRTVLTFVGSPLDVEEAAFQSIRIAAQLIDLNHHTGAHPRIGATDVVPFVPLAGASLQDCVEIAQRLGKRVGEELEIPVYLYEQAATRPERQNLENIRRGQYEALKNEIGVEPTRQPDFGPSSLGPAGATVIGARQALIAFNAYLDTDRVEIAKKIARAVRSSSGGLRYVKALGFLVQGRAQVSMNLTDFKHTPIARVLELVRIEARRYGASVERTELVGLIPQAAITEAAAWYLQLDGFTPEQVLENRISIQAGDEASTTADIPVSADARFLDALASERLTPGGGAAAAYTVAEAAALVAMVARTSLRKKQLADLAPRFETIIVESESLKEQLYHAVGEDAAVFEALLSAVRLPKNTANEANARAQAIRRTAEQACEIPLQVARCAMRVIDLAAELADKGNPNAAADAAGAAELACAGLRTCGYNIHANVGWMQDPVRGEQFLDEARALETQADAQVSAIQASFANRAGRSGN